MFPRGFRLPLVLLALGASALAGPDEYSELDELQLEYRAVKKRYRLLSARREEQLRILKLALDMRDAAAIDWVVAMTRNSANPELQQEILSLLAKKQPDNSKVINLHREFMVAEHALRLPARDFLLDWAVKKGERAWLLRLFASSEIEDQFLAIRALGRIAAPDTLALLWRLLKDKSWKPSPNTVVNCGVLAIAARTFEGGEAARFLILLQRDARFQDPDKSALRQATRLWEHGDLARYVDIRELAHPDGQRREAMARFVGAAGFEAARAPLLGLARDRLERVPVREAATEALGGLTIARADLACELSRLLKDPEPKVCGAAVRALARLRVKQAVAVLVTILDGDLGQLARTELARREKLPAETDWAAWVASKDCPLPEGT